MAGYNEWVEATDVEIKEAYEPPAELVEYEETGDNGMAEEVEETTQIQSRAKSGSMEWTVKAKIRKISGGFSARSGQTIKMDVILDPEDLSVHVGIIEPDGIRRYVTGKRNVSHDFKLDQIGTYRVFVENQNSKSVKASVMYKIK